MSMNGETENESGSSSRPKLSLQPRGAFADSAEPPAAGAVNAVKTSKPSPFGDARPLEQVIAEREGKNETKVLKEQAQKEWKTNILLTDSQHEEKKAAEAELAFVQSEFGKETDPAKLETLKEEVSLKEKRLEELMASFEKMEVQTGQIGGSRRMQDKGSGANATSATENTASLGSFPSRGQGRGGERLSYGNAWSAAKGRSRPSQCYTCGQMGHFSRDCPSKANIAGPYVGYIGPVGGRGGGSQACYTCGQQGHFSRECPYAGGYGIMQYAGQPGYGAYYGGYQGYPYTVYDGGIYGADQLAGYEGGPMNLNQYPNGVPNYSGRGRYRS